MPDVGVLSLVGAQPSRPSKFAPLSTQTFFSGLVTQRSPFNSLDNRYNRRFLGGRPDQLIDGLNTEISNYGTIIRRPGTTLFSTATFPAPILSFYSFHLFPSGSGPGSILVMVDTSTEVDIATPTSKTTLFTKAAGAGQTYFQSVGNTLYMGDGVEQKKWLQFADEWEASTVYSINDIIIDSNSGIEQVSSINFSINHFSITSNVLTCLFNSDVTLPTGAAVLLTGFTTGTYLNNQTIVVSTFVPGTLTAAFTHANVGSTADTGSGKTTTPGSSCSSNTVEPTWPTVVGNTVNDGNSLNHDFITWILESTNLQNWGIDAPTVAPTVANTQLPSGIPVWAASTFYNPSLLLYDNNSPAHLQLLTTAGTTGGTIPTFSTVGGTTTDGSAVWTDQGVAAWQSAHTYSIGNVVLGATNYTYVIDIPPFINSTTYFTTYAFFKCTTAGISGSTEPTLNSYNTDGSTSITTTGWPSGYGSTIQDNTVTWTNIGPVVQWTATLSGSVGINGTTPVVTNTSVIDANSNIENVLYPGKSGSSAPTWSKIVGATTPDGGVTWTNAGPPAGNQAAGTGTWTYVFSFKNGATGGVSTVSPVSLSITVAAESYITVQGPYSPDPQVTTIEIFRTAQGGSVFNFLADIPNPDSGMWTYADTTPDSRLNNLITAPLAHSNDAPPAGLVKMTYHLNRIWGVVGNNVYYSGGPDTIVGNGSESFPPANVFVFPNQVNRLVPMPLGLLVFTTDDLYLISGTTISTFYDSIFQSGIGLLSWNALDVEGSAFYFYTADRRFMNLSSSGYDEIGFAIGDLLQANINPTTAYVAALSSGTSDQAVFIADGSSSWYRCNPSQMPEGTPAWSPKAIFESGATAVAQCETTPGTHQLLIGTVSGNILARNLSVYSDNGDPYSAYATLGSIVLAQPGQIALVESTTLEDAFIGQVSTVSVLLEEITGNFEDLPEFTNDPPGLSPSQTVRSNRYYLNQGRDAVECRHLQLKVSYSETDAVRNEIYTLSLYGALILNDA